MDDLCSYGLYRSIEPLNSLPQPAWKIDNDMAIRNHEILVSVDIININSVSFTQIVESEGGDKKKISERIIGIIEERGKLHNPVTGTGGMFYGEVKKIGDAYPNHHDIKVGDKIISLASLTLTPIRIKKILDIDMNFAQLKVEGEAIMFGNAPLIKPPEGLPLKLLIATLDEAGAPTQTYNIIKKNDNVLIMGAGEKAGLLCAFAARKKIGRSGGLFGTVNSIESKNLLDKYDIFTDLIVCDASDLNKVLSETKKRDWVQFDTVINCINLTGSETTSLILTKNHGRIFFPGLDSNYKMTALMAEGVSKDIEIIPYKGYINGHAQFTIELLKKQTLRTLLYKISKNKKPEERKELFSYSDHHKVEKKDNKYQDLYGYVFTSGRMKEVYESAVRVSKYNCTVTISGESGVGKEVIVHLIHMQSSRKFFPFIKINCASIPEGLLESELFGYEKGAFTGAGNSGKAGFFEIAQNGTLFLDEIGELPLKLQGKLLRVLQDHEIYRIGGIKPVKVDVRIITATNKNLETMIQKKLFRSDLFYRLNVFPIKIPPLRERREDIIPLLQLFLKKYNEEFKISKKFDDSILEYFYNYDWPGNIRELQNCVQRLLINSKNEFIKLDDIKKHIEEINLAEVVDNTLDLKKILHDTEYKLLEEAKKQYKTSRKTAQALGISQSAYIKKLKKYSISS